MKTIPVDQAKIPTADKAPTGALCGSHYLEVKMPVEHCETCDQPRRMLLTVAAWYGAHWTCLTCGEQWDADEGRKERPFMPAWRRKNVEEAKSFWKRHGRKRLNRAEVLAI